MTDMGRKVALATAMTLAVVLSAGLAGGQVGFGGAGIGATGTGFLWWGNHEPIYIYGDDDFTVQNGVMSGSGTPEDPYVIEGWRIDAPRADYGIYIDHTTRHFVIRDCVIERARIAGVYLNSARNGTVTDMEISLSNVAIYLLNSDRNWITRSVIADCCYGIVMAADSDGNTISENSFIENGLNALDPMRENCWYEEGVGNYWSDFVGRDADGNGVYDAPNYRFGDPCPLVSPPVEQTGVTTAGLTFSGNWVSPDGSLVVTSQTPIALQAADPGSGLAEIHYAVDCEDWTVYGGPIYLTGEDGPRRISYYSVDYLGNREAEKTVSFILDNHPPVTVVEVGDPNYVSEQGQWLTSRTPITLRRTQESTYGRTITYFRVDSRNWQVYYEPFLLYAVDGPHQISYYSRNASGVAEDLKTIILFKDDAPPTTRGQQHGSTSIDVVVGEPASAIEPPVPSVTDEPTPTAEPEPAVVPEPELVVKPEPEPEPEPETVMTPEAAVEGIETSDLPVEPELDAEEQTPPDVSEPAEESVEEVQTPSDTT